MNFYKKYKYFFILNILSINNKSTSTKNIFNKEKSILIGNFFNTFGVTTKIFYNNENLTLKQFNIKLNIITSSKTNFDLKNKSFFKMHKVEGEVFEKIIANKYSNSEIKIFLEGNVGDGTKNKENFTSANIYGYLNIINKFDILNNYKPDFDILCLDEEEISNKNKFYTLYYRMVGANKKYNQHVYINEWRNYSMGDFIGIFSTPAYIFNSGNGEETFLYLGVHDCKNKRIVGIMLIQFDLYGKILKYFHHIPLCEECHSNYENIPLVETIDLSNKK
jgi:hypothetical protein